MKTIGLIGGMSWVSTAHYYRHINQSVATQLGGDHCARMVVWQEDFDLITALQRAGDWDGAGAILASGAVSLVAAGAEVVAICANTMHLVADVVRSAIDPVPLVHIVENVRDECVRRGISRIGLVGTAYTMESPALFPPVLGAAGIDVLVPDADDRAAIQAHTFDELIRDVVTDKARSRFASAADAMVHRGAQCIVLACTEHSLVLSEGDVLDANAIAVPMIDTAALHADAIVRAALGDA
jgi:aspartate racemase